MSNPRLSRAPLCHRRAVRVIAIAIAPALASCGGIAASPIDGGPQGGAEGGPITASVGCPSMSDIDSNAAVGKACAPAGTYCFNPACDACTKNCPAVSCTHAVWTPAINTAICTGNQDASAEADVGVPFEGGACGAIDSSTYDKTCTTDSSCIAITSGTFCSDTPWCICLGDTINVDGQSRYKKELSDLQSRLMPGPGGCSCPFLGNARCVQGRCTICGPGGSNPGCPDGG